MSGQITRLLGVDFANNGLPVLAIAPNAVVTTLAGTAGAAGTADGTGAAARFNNPIGLALDPTGTFLYVCDGTNNRIRKINVTTGVVTTFAGDGTAAEADGVGVLAKFNAPQGIIVDHAGVYAYVCDITGCTIRRITLADGTVTTFAGDGTGAEADGVGVAAKLNGPADICIDLDDAYLYVVDYTGQTVRRIRVTDATVTTLAGASGVAGTTDAVGTAARFSNPDGVAMDMSGSYLYVAEYTNKRIRKINLSTAQVTTFAGTTSGSDDGFAIAARFNNLQNIALDPSGKLMFVADRGNNKVRKIEMSSVLVSTFAGSGAAAEADGTGVAAQLNVPAGIVYDHLHGVLYVADRSGYTIRKIE